MRKYQIDYLSDRINYYVPLRDVTHCWYTPVVCSWERGAMTTNNQHNDLRIDRRTILKSAAAVGVLGSVGLPAISGSAVANSSSVETLYLTDSGGDNGGNFLGKLYSVDLDDSISPPRANLTLLKDFDDGDFGQVDAIAASLDGSTIFLVDKVSKHLGTYDVNSGDFTDEGAISDLPEGVVLASYSPDGTLYVLSQNNNKMYTVDVSGPSASEYVTITGANVQGADIAFDADGVLYLYSSSAQALYTVDYDSSSGTFGQATKVGDTGDFFTGLAVRDAGNGDLVGSNTNNDAIVVVDKGTGAQGTTYEMYFEDSPYKYGYGDMTVGALDICVPCDLEEALKYEYVFEEDGDDEDYDPDVDGFVPEDGDGFGYLRYDSKEGEDYEPITVYFENPGDYCADTLAVTVKAGPIVGDVEVTENEDGELVVSIEDDVTFENEKNGKLYAISYIEFDCVESE